MSVTFFVAKRFAGKGRMMITPAFMEAEVDGVPVEMNVSNCNARHLLTIAGFEAADDLCGFASSWDMVARADNAIGMIREMPGIGSRPTEEAPNMVSFGGQRRIHDRTAGDPP